MGHGGGIIKRIKRHSTYAILCMLCLVVAAIPISGAVGDQNSDENGANPTDGMNIGVTDDDVQTTEDVLQSEQPFGENTTQILGVNTTTDNGTLKLGSNGDKVKKLQQWLTDYGYYSGPIDGVFGADTEAAVKTFQDESGLIVDGVVGKDTQSAMDTWDKVVADVQAAAGETSTSSGASSGSKATYASAVRSYSSSYSGYSGYSSSGGYSWTTGKGTGDCWDNSAALYSQLTSSGTQARIVQYANSYVSNHRSVEVWTGSGWSDYDYAGNGYDMGYYATSHSDSSSTVIQSSI